jgi:hypothetical protein
MDLAVEYVGVRQGFLPPTGPEVTEAGSESQPCRLPLRGPEPRVRGVNRSSPTRPVAPFATACVQAQAGADHQQRG